MTLLRLVRSDHSPQSTSSLTHQPTAIPSSILRMADADAGYASLAGLREQIVGELNLSNSGLTHYLPIGVCSILNGGI